jgi:uncharacterized protein (TIGR00661 family)
LKIFYGCQATGNGHITRARAMAPKLKQAGIHVDFLFSGRPWDQLFEMDVFGDYQWRRGLTFSTKSGHIQYLKTARETHALTFIRDVKALDLSGYDAVICDFEPVTGWAAKLQGLKTIGIGHQYAFGYDIPKAGADFFGEKVLTHFAPASVGLGVHWHHFHRPILPPIIETDVGTEAIQADKIIVYLPFEDVDHVIQLLQRFSQHQFYIYSPTMPVRGKEKHEHIHVRQLSRAGFQQDFANAAGVICNAGFELASEALNTGKKLLVKPLHGQMEQLSNALALELLQLGEVMQSLDTATIETWLERAKGIRVKYPDVAQKITDWLLQGDFRVDQAWIDGVWSEVVQSTP